MYLHQKSYTSTASPFVVDLRTIGDVGVLGQEGANAGLVYELADFDIEVTGNDSEVVLTGTGPFSNSAAKAVTDGTFAITIGGKKTISKSALGSLTFTFSGSAGFIVNIVRKVY